jgi:hypothetical protein
MLAAATAIAGCQGGATIGSGGGPTPVTVGTSSPTPIGATPSPTPVGATPSPTPFGATPSPSPSAAVTGAIYHPPSNGDTFAMGGTLMYTYARPNQYPTPEPTSTSFATVAQTITVTNPVGFNGNTNAVDFAISETDSQTAPDTESFSETYANYYAFSNTSVTGNFLNLGSTETDTDSGYTTTTQNGPNDQLADILPETKGATWSNMAGRTITFNDGYGETGTTTYNNDGSYNGTITYPDQNPPSPNPTGSQLTNVATLVTKTDGSASYNTPRLGTALQYNYQFTFAAPTVSGPSGTITETEVIPPAVGSTAGPTTSTTSIPNWMPASVPGSLASETDVDNGPSALPSPCAVGSAYAASTPNQIVQTKTSVDPLNGELDTATTTTYDLVNVGPICVILHDVQTDYYDLTGQNGVGYFLGVPQQITTLDETLYLQSETLQSIARRPDARAIVASHFGLANASSRASMLRFKQRMRRLIAGARGPSRFTSSRSFRGILQ